MSENSAENYKKSGKNGILYIISNEKFDNGDDHLGNPADETALIKAFTYLNFDIVQPFKNCDIGQIKNQIAKIRLSNFEGYKHFAMAVLTHGDRHGSLWSKDTVYNLDTSIVLPILQNKTLKDKLKLFIIEANRGTFDVIGQSTDTTRFYEKYWLTECLRCYATNEGFKSLLIDCDSGSYFTQTFCDLIMRHGKDRCISKIMDDTKAEVMRKTRNRQVPCSTSSLTREFILGTNNQETETEIQ